MQHSMHIVRIAILLISIAGVTACNAGSFKSSPTRAKATGDGRRPSEQGEGVTGYLREPENLEYQHQDGMIRVRGKENAVATSDGRSPAGLAICLQSIAKQSLIDRISQNARFEGDDFVTLADSTVNPDGSFLLETTEGKPVDDRVLTINATGQCRNGGATNVTAPNQIVFMSADNEGSFSDVTEINNIKQKEWNRNDDEADSAVLCTPGIVEKCANIQVNATDIYLGNTVVGELIVIFYPPNCVPQARDDKRCKSLDSIIIQSGDYLRTHHGEYTIVIDAEKYELWSGNIPESVVESVINAVMTPIPQAATPDLSTSTETSNQ